MTIYIDAGLARELINYTPDTGEFFWKRRGREYFTSDRDWNRWNNRFAGQPSGSVKINKNGYVYLRITLLERGYAAGRLAWVWMTGEQPPKVVDHIDGDALNNRWDNIRDGSGSLNQKNRAVHQNNTSGVGGVNKCPSGRWMARAHHDGKRYYLGIFGDIREAERVVKEFRSRHGFTERHGSVN